MTGNNFYKDTTKRKDTDRDLDSTTGIISIKEGQLIGEIPNQLGKLGDYED